MSRIEHGVAVVPNPSCESWNPVQNRVPPSPGLPSSLSLRRFFVFYGDFRGFRAHHRARRTLAAGFQQADWS